MHPPTNRIAHTMAFVIPVVDNNPINHIHFGLLSHDLPADNGI